MGDRLPRKLAAILYADVAGYSRLTGEDEDFTHRRLSEYLDVISAAVEGHRGRVMHYAGDAVLAMFEAVVDAVSSAIEVQKTLRERNQDLPEGRRVEFRVGVNLGDVIEDRGDIYGDGVNVAARLESLAPPGGICTSGTVHDTLGTKLGLVYEFMGEQQVKNIADPVRAFRIRQDDREVTTEGITVADELSERSSGELRASVAVLPFAVVGTNRDVEELSDGITDTIINTLSRTGQCRVADRASAFGYKDQSLRPREVAEHLEVQHVMQGSVQQSGNRVRITAGLFDVQADDHVWSERFDRTLDDVFDLQDEIAMRITQAVRGSVVYGKLGRAWEKPTDSFDAWLFNIQGVETWHKVSAGYYHEARGLWERVMELDPRYFWGPHNVAWTHFADCVYGWSESPAYSSSTKP